MIEVEVASTLLNRLRVVTPRCTARLPARATGWPDRCVWCRTYRKWCPPDRGGNDSTQLNLTAEGRHEGERIMRTRARGALAGVAPLSFLAAAGSAGDGFAAERGGAVPTPAAAQEITGLALDEPELAHKPEVRWWLSQGRHTDETIKESVQEIADAGFAGIEFAQLNEPNVDASKFAHGSPEWTHDVELIIGEATKHGLSASASFTSGTHWATANIPGLDANSEAANHDVGNAHSYVPQGSTLTTVPTPSVAPGRTQRFVSAVAYKLTTPHTASPTIRQPLQVDPSSVVDHTEDAKDGRINFHISAQEEQP